MMLLFGWSLYQFAIAKAHHKKLTGEDMPATLDGAVEIQKWWMMRRNDTPGEIRLIAIDPFLDLAWSSRMFQSAAEECKPYLR